MYNIYTTIYFYFIIKINILEFIFIYLFLTVLFEIIGTGLVDAYQESILLPLRFS